MLPVEFRENVWEHKECMELIELVLDYGRKPLARFPGGDYILCDRTVTNEDLKSAICSVRSDVLLTN